VKPQLIRIKDLATNEFKDIRDKQPGVYIVFWIKDGEPVLIRRICGADQRGTLYIGSSKNLREELRGLWESIEIAAGKKRYKRKKLPHTLGPSLIYTGLFQHIRDEDLWIYFKEFATSKEAEDQERRALLEYSRMFGEPPPLNLQVGREYFLILGLGRLSKSRLAPKLDPDLKSALGISP
jgi:hypothetical protein